MTPEILEEIKFFERLKGRLEVLASQFAQHEDDAYRQLMSDIENCNNWIARLGNGYVLRPENLDIAQAKTNNAKEALEWWQFIVSRRASSSRSE